MPRSSRLVFLPALFLIVSACASSPETPTNTPPPPPTPTPEAGPNGLLWSFTGDDDPLRRPSGLAVDSDGRLFIVDTLNHRILITSPDGVVVDVWGGPGEGPGRFNFIWKTDLAPNEEDEVAAGVAIGPDGAVYVTDVGNHRIQVLDAEGNFLRQWPVFSTRDNGPHDLAINSEGHIYTIDRKAFIMKYGRDGSLLLSWGGNGIGDGVFQRAGNLAIDGEDNVYVADIFQSSIEKFDSNGNFLARFELPLREDGKANRSTPFGVTIAPDGRILMTDILGHRVAIMDQSGNLLAEFGDNGTEPGMFSGPIDIALAPDGSVYVSEIFFSRVQKFRLEE